MRMLLALIGAGVIHGAALAACPPPGYTAVQLSQLRAAKWEVADHAQRQALALGMLDCLADPDPVLRDERGFESLQAWMRGRKLDPATLQALRGALLATLDQHDGAGFARPFAALVLAEVVRADRIEPFMSESARATLVKAATGYLAALRDYRGFDQKEGWRHGVAHGADLMLQLALHPALGKAEHQAMLAAIATQLSAPAAQVHFYHYGEGERLMAPVFYLARRGTLDNAEWEAWFAALAAGAGPAAPATQASLARRHNLKAFLLPLYASLGESGDAATRARLLPFVTKALRQLE